MQTHHTHWLQKTLALTLLALAVPAWWWVIQSGTTARLEPRLFLLLHNATELLTIVVAAMVSATGYRALLSKRQGALVVMGVAFLGVALLDLLHTVTYAGMPDALSTDSAQKSLFFWLCARLLAAMALLAYVWLPVTPAVSAQHKRLAVLLMVCGVGVLGYSGLVWPQDLPALFITGQGLTKFAITLKWSAVAIHLLTLAVLWVRRVALADESVRTLAFAVALSVVSQSFLAVGDTDVDAATICGLLFKAAAYLFLFEATVRQSLRQPLRRLNTMHLRERQVLQACPEGILWVNQAGQILLANPAMENLSGYTANELVAQNVDIFLPQHRRAYHAEVMRGYFRNPSTRPMASNNVELDLVHRSGEVISVNISLGFWEDENESHAIAYVHDLRERKAFEETLRHRATHDQLTGLPNRWLFNLHLTQALALAKRNSRQVAVLMLDLDDFKKVNDSYGHATGDAMLTQVAQRLRQALRDYDTLARLGGDEFAILLGDLQYADEARAVADKLIASMSKVFALQNCSVHSSVSIGLAFYPTDAQDSENIIRCADMAMYQAKRSARAIYACYSTNLEQRARENLELHVRLKDALEQGQLKLFYQPQFDASGQRIVGAEALLRWHDAELGEVSPARFIPVAESNGVILPISAWVLETACQQIAAWHQAGTPLQVAVNFSVQQFRQGNVAEQVRAALQRTGAPAHLLEIEITESIAMEHPEAAHAQLSQLVALGCTVALDDFGTGYSSLAYLKSLPVSVLKIDRSFVKDLPGGTNDTKICRAIIALAHSLDMTLVAEGVETDAQLGFLRSYGCEVFQGWLFAKAMPVSELTARLLKSRDKHEVDFEALASKALHQAFQ